MSVTARYQIDQEQIDQMDMTISLTMPVREWERLYEAIGSGPTPFAVREAIRNALERVELVTGQTFDVQP